MSGMGMKERAALATLGVIVAFALVVGSWFFHFESAWKKSRKSYEDAKAKYERECALIVQKPKLVDEYEAEKKNMPIFAADKATDTTWRRKVDALAEKHHIVISSAQAGKEIEAGDVLELPIDIRTWEASLQSLVQFMHELENTSEGMFDIKALSMKPSNKKGYLKGSMSLTCAYMRER